MLSHAGGYEGGMVGGQSCQGPPHPPGKRLRLLFDQLHHHVYVLSVRSDELLRQAPDCHHASLQEHPQDLS